MTKEERVLARARMLMQTKGYGWSKAIDRAAESVQREIDEEVNAVLHDPSISTEELTQRIIDGYRVRKALERVQAKSK